MDFENIKITGADISVIGTAFIFKSSNFELFSQLTKNRRSQLLI